MKQPRFDDLLRASLQQPPPINPVHQQQTAALLASRLRSLGPRPRIGFGALLLRQIAFIGWRVWLAQGLFLLTLMAVLYHSVGVMGLREPHIVFQLLCCLSLLVLLTALPLLGHARHHCMHEIEAATFFSATQLLAARLIILCFGDTAMLVGLWLIAWHCTPLAPGTALLMLLLPYLLTAYCALWLLGRLPARSCYTAILILCGVLVLLILLLGRFLTPLLCHTHALVWLLLCAALTVGCLWQSRSLLRRSRFTELQLI